MLMVARKILPEQVGKLTGRGVLIEREELSLSLEGSQLPDAKYTAADG